MKLKVLFTFVTVIVLLCGAWLYLLSSGVAAQFQQLFDQINVNLPEITRSLFAALDYWWVMMIPIIFFSYLPLFGLKGNWQYAAIIISIFSLLTLVGVVYLPLFKIGAVV